MQRTYTQKFIDRNTSIITSIDYQLAESTKKFVSIKNVLGVKFQVSSAMVHIQYQMIGEKCHLKHVKASISVHIFNKKDYDLTHTFTSEMLVNKVSFQERNPFQRSEVYKKNSLYKRGNNFNSNFWEDQRSILTTGQEDKIIKELYMRMDSTKKNKRKPLSKANPVGEFKSGFAKSFTK